MAVNIDPIFPVTPRVGFANISAANTARTATGVTNLVQVIGAGTNGTRVDTITIQATGASTTAGMVRLWYYSGSGNAQLIQEVPVSAITPSGTVQAFTASTNYTTLVIPAGSSIYASTNNAEAFNVVAFGGDY